MPFLSSVKSIKTILRGKKPTSIIIVSSKNLINKLDWAIKEMNFPFASIIEIPDGESAKEWGEIEKLLKKFVNHNLGRNGIVIALGGGTIGDAVGFASSIYLRGVKYIQIPTTLLAQVDSAHGGKTGINFLGYKNQIGTFYSPLATIVDTRFIKSLSKEQIIDGLGEIIKAGIIKDSTILSFLKKETIDKLPASRKLLIIIEKAIKVKQYYINKDFKDTGVRQILNFGHTFGHAIELKYNISHGQAVIMGMLQELEVAEKLKLTPTSVKNNLEMLLESLGIKLDYKIKADHRSILHDKKLSGNQIFLPVILNEGKVKIIKLDAEKLKDFL